MNKHFFITLLGTAVLASCNSTNNESATALKESAEKISKLTDSIKKIDEQRLEALNFSLETNELAQQYFEDLKIDNPSQIVMNALMEMNVKDHNPYIKSESNGKFLFNKIRILNESLSMIRGNINEIESKNTEQDESIDTSNTNIINLTTSVSNL